MITEGHINIKLTKVLSTTQNESRRNEEKIFNQILISKCVFG